jgi:hypothetical protein
VSRKKSKKDHPSQTVAKDYTKNLPFDDRILVIALTVIAAAVRLYKINYPTSVVFDEVHFGGFATKYHPFPTRRNVKQALIVGTSKVNFSWMFILPSLRCSSPLRDGWPDLMENLTLKKLESIADS